MAVDATAGDKIGRRGYQGQANGVFRHREPLLGLGLLLLAFVVAFGAREAASTHAGRAVASRAPVSVVEPTVTVVAPQEVAASGSLRLPPVPRAHARRRPPAHHAVAAVAAPAVTVAPATHTTSSAVASAPSVTPSAGTGVGVVGSGSSGGGTSAPPAPAPTPAPPASAPTPTPTAPVHAPSGTSGTGSSSSGSSSSGGSGNVTGGG